MERWVGELNGDGDGVENKEGGEKTVEVGEEEEAEKKKQRGGKVKKPTSFRELLNHGGLEGYVPRSKRKR